MAVKSFYVKQGERILGPYEYGQLDGFFRQGLFTDGDQVSGDQIDWEPFGDWIARPAPEEPSEPDKPAAIVPPKPVMAQEEWLELAVLLKSSRNSLLPCFILAALLGLAGILIALVVAAAREPLEPLPLIARGLRQVGELGEFIFWILSLIALYRCWKLVPAEDRRPRSPLAMVLLLLIPLFNLFWGFVAVCGLATRLNRINRAPGSTPVINAGLILAGYSLALILCIVRMMLYINPETRIPLMIPFLGFLQFILDGGVVVAITFAARQLASSQA